MGAVVELLKRVFRRGPSPTRSCECTCGHSLRPLTGWSRSSAVRTFSDELESPGLRRARGAAVWFRSR
jgi:hypothetical protein